MIGYILLALAVVLLCTWLFLIAPGDSEGMEKYKDKKYAHRGLHGAVGADTFSAENSMTAFGRAVERGYGIELDVRLSKDGELVVFHDATLDRVTDGTGKVCDYTLEELKTFKLMGTEDTIPTLKEVLDLVDGRIPLLVEMKSDGTDKAVAETCAAILKDYKGDYIVESFNPICLSVFKKILPSVPRGFLCDKHTAKKENRSLLFRAIQRFFLNVICRPAFIAMNKKRPKMFPLPLVKALFKTPAVAWTVRSKEEEIEAYKNGFSGVIFEGYLSE